jgi:hypothetical protein
VSDKVNATKPKSAGTRNHASAIWLPKLASLLSVENRRVHAAPRAAYVPTGEVTSWGEGVAVPARFGGAMDEERAPTSATGNEVPCTGRGQVGKPGALR